MQEHNQLPNGMIIIIGAPFEDDLPKNAPPLGEELKALALQKHPGNVMVIYQATDRLSLDELSAKIKEFSSAHNKVSVFAAMHGAHVMKGHDVAWYPVEDYFLSGLTEGWRPWYPSAYINSEDFLKAVADGAGAHLQDLWYYACQNGDLIEAAKTILPRGSTLITTGPGYIYDYGWTSAILMNWLDNNPSELTSDSFMSCYLAMLSNETFRGTREDEKTKQIVKNDLKGAYNFNPVKTIIGADETVDLARKATEFLQKLNSGEITQDMQANIEHYLFAHGAHYSYSIDSLKGKGMENCPTNLGEGLYLINQIVGIASQESIKQPTDCTLTQSEYMLALAAADAYEHIKADHLPGSHSA